MHHSSSRHVMLASCVKSYYPFSLSPVFSYLCCILGETPNLSRFDGAARRRDSRADSCNSR
eukprot:6208050-Pleurochrysis_carterae.AAC.1